MLLVSDVCKNEGLFTVESRNISRKKLDTAADGFRSAQQRRVDSHEMENFPCAKCKDINICLNFNNSLNDKIDFLLLVAVQNPEFEKNQNRNFCYLVCMYVQCTCVRVAFFRPLLSNT